MELLISLIVTGLVIVIYIRNFAKNTARLNAESKTVSCTKCHTKMNRQRYEQQCPKCRAIF